jgi:hypothetical protein
MPSETTRHDTLSPLFVFAAKRKGSFWASVDEFRLWLIERAPPE